MIPASLHHRPPSAPQAGGFTLVELLVTMVAGIVIIGVAGPIIVSDIRGGLTTERFQRAKQDFLRLSSFIDSEVSEGSRLQYALATTGCSPGGTSLVTITIPYGYDPSTLLPAEVLVHYYVVGGALYRCGPPIQANGALIPAGTPAPSLLNTNTQMIVNGPSNAKGLAYTLQLRNENNEVIFSGTGGSRTRAGIIDN